MKLLKFRNFALNIGYQLRQISQDVDEVSKFKKFKDWWGDPKLKVLRDMNELRVPLIVNQLTGKQSIKTAHPLKEYRLLDIGCGGGLLCEPLARLGARITGIDPNSDGIHYCDSRLSGTSSDLKSNLNYVTSKVEQFSSKETNGQFDAVIASEVLEHIEDVESVIKTTHELLKPNGLFFITTINQTITAYLVAIFGAETVLGMIPKGTHHYNLLVPLLSLKIMLEKNNFDVKLTHGFVYNPLTQKWFWTTNTLVNYAVVAQKSCNTKV